MRNDDRHRSAEFNKKSPLGKIQLELNDQRIAAPEIN